MWRWYVEVGFLVLLCFGAGMAVAALVLAKVLPPAAPQEPTASERPASGGPS